jgi:hypothetical protein
MFLERYEVENNPDYTVFEFLSVGTKGTIIKQIRYSKYHNLDVYNLGFGDFDEKNNEINDLVITDNGDFEKVLATVASTLYIFTEEHPEVWVLIRGSSKSRIRLYQIGITKFFNEINQTFNIQGLKEKIWYDFEKNINFEAFLIKRK